MLSWKGDARFEVRGATFTVLPADVIEGGLDFSEGDRLVFKPREMVERYVRLVEELAPERIFELGIYGGGSTMLLAALAMPRRLAAIDRRPLKGVRRRLEADSEALGMVDAVRTFGGVDQADRPELARIAAECFDDAPLDLVVDDCSHLYEPTKASFNELFPRLRPGGVYVIEDWAWAHPGENEEHSEVWRLDGVPLSRFLFEILLAVSVVPGLIAKVEVERHAAFVRRGELALDHTDFEISDHIDPAGRTLLASG